MTRLSRLPPPVLYPLGRSAVLGFILAALVCAGAGVLFGWTLRGVGTTRWPVWAAFVLWSAAAVAALHFWSRQCRGTLQWDGRHWQLDETGDPGNFLALSAAPEVLLDVQSHLWVCVIPVGRGRIWLWLDRSRQPEKWMDLRRAVYSRATPGADTADTTALASSREA